MAAPVFCVLHVPKCAGRTIEVHLEKKLGEDGFWSVPKRTRNFPLEVLGRKYDKRFPGAVGKIKAVSGHFIGRSIEQAFSGRQIKRVVLLRRPVDLLLSWYNYRMMRYIANGQAPYPFALHLRSFASNPVANFLLERWLEMPLWKVMSLSLSQKVRYLDQVLSEFDFVGDIEDCDKLVNLIADELGIEGKADRRNTQADWRKRVDWIPIQSADLSEQTLKDVHGLTQIDEYLWRRWALKEDISFEPVSSRNTTLLHEVKRPYFELRRRLQRSWGSHDPSQWARGSQV